MPWTTIHLQTTTPLFNGGADNAGLDNGAGFRISSLRGAMRFWFRALAGLGLGDNLTSLATLERHVFGATDRASPVKLRLIASPPPSRPGQPAWCQGTDGRWIVYLLGQGLGNLREVSVIKPYIAAGRTITVQARLGVDGDTAAIVLAALWLTCAYGGLGARTRRGFGGLRITDADDTLPEPWTPQTLRTPGLEFHDGVRHLWPAGPLQGCMPVLSRLANSIGIPFALAGADAPPPRYPTFSRTYTAAGLSGGEHFTDWTYLLGHTGQQLRHFRASRPVPGAGYRPPVKTPEWLDVVHGPPSQTHFGLGALGLPVNFKDRYTVNAYTRDPDVPLRRASPLWLRPIGQDRTWRLLSFAFHSKFLPDNAETLLQKDNRLIKRVTVDRSDVVDRSNDWISNLRNDIDLSQAT